MNLKSFSKIIAVTSGLLGGVLLNLILSGGIGSLNFSITIVDLVKAALMLIAVVGGAAWILSFLLMQPANERDSD